MTLYYEDINKGDELPELVKDPVTHTQLVRYSGASGDFNPIHTVPDVAKMVGLPNIIAHGMLIMGFAGQFITDWAGAGSMRRFKVRFSGMTNEKESVVCRGSVLEKSEVDGEYRVKGRFTVKGADDDSLKLKGDFEVAVESRG